MSNIITRVETTSRCGWADRNGKCGKPRASHRGSGHRYEPVWNGNDPGDVMVLCDTPSCGMAGIDVDRDLANIPDIFRLLAEGGWRIIDGMWHCPRCAAKFDKREAKKRDPRQASFMDGVNQ